MTRNMQNAAEIIHRKGEALCVRAMSVAMQNGWSDRIGARMIRSNKVTKVRVEEGGGIAFTRECDVWVRPGKAYATETDPYSDDMSFCGYIEIPLSTAATVVRQATISMPNYTQYEFSVVRIENGIHRTLFSKSFYAEDESDPDGIEAAFIECANRATRGMEKIAF